VSQDFADATCPICSGKAIDPFERVDDWQYCICRDCEFVFSWPKPVQSDLNELYNDQPEGDGFKFSQASSRRRRALTRALKFRRFVKGGRNAIDIGCGGGFIVDALRLVGARAHGLDVSPRNIAYAKRRFPKCEFHLASFDSVDLPAGRFSFVYSADVIEHVSDLDSYVGLISRLLRPGGHAFVSTPDIDSPVRPANILEWGPFAPPEHIQYFNEGNIRLLFERAGLTFVSRYKERRGKDGMKMLFRR
jgi:SAM-dependent methyltransferase